MTIGFELWSEKNKCYYRFDYIESEDNIFITSFDEEFNPINDINHLLIEDVGELLEGISYIKQHMRKKAENGCEKE